MHLASAKMYVAGRVGQDPRPLHERTAMHMQLRIVQQNKLGISMHGTLLVHRTGHGSCASTMPLNHKGKRARHTLEALKHIRQCEAAAHLADFKLHIKLLATRQSWSACKQHLQTALELVAARLILESLEVTLAEGDWPVHAQDLNSSRRVVHLAQVKGAVDVVPKELVGRVDVLVKPETTQMCTVSIHSTSNIQHWGLMLFYIPTALKSDSCLEVSSLAKAVELLLLLAIEADVGVEKVAVLEGDIGVHHKYPSALEDAVFNHHASAALHLEQDG